MDVYEGDSIAEAVQQANDGDTITVHEGVYNIPNSGPRIQIENSITLRGEGAIIYGNYPTDQDAVFDGIRVRASNVTIEGFIIEGFHSGVRMYGGHHHIKVKGCELRYNSEAGVNNCDTGCADYVTVEDNYIHHNGLYRDGTPATGVYEGQGSGITFNARSVPFWLDHNSGPHSVIKGNVIHDNWDGKAHADGNGIIMDHWGEGPDVLIERNVCYHNGGRGIHPYLSHNIWIVNNTCYHNGQDVQVWGNGEIAGYSDLDNIHVIDNIAWCKDGGYITFFPDGPLDEMVGNIWWGDYVDDGRSPWGNEYMFIAPMFVGPPDFHLLPESPAIGKGALDETSPDPSGWHCFLLGQTVEAIDFDLIVSIRNYIERYRSSFVYSHDDAQRYANVSVISSTTMPVTPEVIDIVRANVKWLEVIEGTPLQIAAELDVRAASGNKYGT